MKNKKLTRALRRSDKKKEDRPILISGELGIALGGQKVVEVPNRRGFVFVRLKNNTSELIQAYNPTVSPVYDLPVLVTRKGTGYIVVGRNVERYSNQWGLAPYLPKHGAQHSFNPELGIGGDITWVYDRQFMPLLAYPSGTNGSPTLSISPYIIRDLNGNWKYVGNTGTPNTTPYNPISGSRIVLVYIDTDSGNPYLLVNTGTYVDLSLTGTNEIVPYIPKTTSPSQMPIMAIRLVSGTSSLTWDNVVDVRPFFQVFSASGTSSGGGGGFDGFGFVGWDEGASLGTGTVLNVVGAGATLTRSGTVFNLEIPGGGGGGGGAGVMAWDEGIPQGTGTVFNFIGDGVRATISGSVVEVAVDGINTGTLDSRYLKLDASNDPLTNSLEIDSPAYAGYFKSNLGYAVLHLEQNGTSFAAEPTVDVVRQSAAGTSGTQFFFPAFQVTDNLNLMRPVDAGTFKHWYYTGTDSFVAAELNPWARATGTIFFIDSQTPTSLTGTFLLFSRQGREIFRINGSGTALSNGVPLIKEAPVDGQQYARKNAGWEIVAAQQGLSGLTGVMGWDEGAPIGTGTILNFVGAGVTATISGTVIHVNVPGTVSPPVTGSVVVYEDSSLLGSVLGLNFRDSIVATISGTTAIIDVTTPATSAGFSDDLTTYIDGVATTFILSHTPQLNTTRLFYNGVRQRFNSHYTISGTYVQTLFTPVTGSTLIADYSESGGSSGGDGDNVFAIGMATAL